MGNILFKSLNLPFKMPKFKDKRCDNPRVYQDKHRDNAEKYVKNF